MVTRAVTLVTGPPCAGKTWHVQQHANPGDVVVCLDLFAREAGSTRRHNHSPEHYELAEDAYAHHVHRLGLVPDGQDLTAWLVRTAPEPDARARLARAVRATEVLVLLPPQALVLARAQQRGGDVDRTCRVIDRWYRRYRPGEGDRVVTPGLPEW